MALRSQLKQLETQSSNLQAQIVALQRQTASLQENNTILQTQNAKLQVKKSHYLQVAVNDHFLKDFSMHKEIYKAYDDCILRSEAAFKY